MEEEEEIIRLAKLKDERAFEKLVVKYKPVVERIAFQFGVNYEYIPDIVQETFIKIYRKIHQFHTGKFSTWIYQITLNVVRDYYRKTKRENNLIFKTKETQLAEQKQGYYFERQEHLFLHECIQKLDIKYKTPLILYYFHEKTYEEIAMILKTKLSTVKTRMHRGKKQLGQIYEQSIGQEVYLNG